MYSSFPKLLHVGKMDLMTQRFFKTPLCMLSWKEANKIESYLVTVGMHAQTNFSFTPFFIQSHLSNSGTTKLTSTGRVDPHGTKESERRPVTHCQAVSETARSDGSCVIPFGLLYVRTLQWWRKTEGFSQRRNSLCMIKVTRRCLRALDM